MAITVREDVSSARVRGAFAGPSDHIDASQLRVLAAYSIPTKKMSASAAYVRAATTGPTDSLKISQLRVLAAVRGKPANPKLRAWTFTLDGHPFYVLRLGDGKTLIYDNLTKQWSWWSSADFPYWRPTIGMNWVSAGMNAQLYGSNIVVGDDTYGMLWVLDPEKGYDDSALNGSGDPKVFPRIATAYQITRGRDWKYTYEVYLNASGGEPALSGQSVTLNLSDDVGHTFISAGDIEIDETCYNQEFAWRSLGKYGAPGRLFQIVDYGAFARIDGLNINDRYEANSA